ncbi:MAG: hypothetical protein J2P23_13720 [Microlunatus sp.]|nr:hypothetical protein [Microlunatus sp.]
MTIDRSAVIRDFGQYVYGVTPRTGVRVECRVLEYQAAFGPGSRARHELTITTERGSHVVELLLCLPNTDRSPVFCGLNFNGNNVVLTEWPIEMILRNGYGVASVHAAAFEPDRANAAAEGVRAILPPAPDDAPWGTIGVWAWGLSLVRRHLESYAHVLSGGVIAIGHSRMGKAALWAAAQDEGFAGVVSNAAGCSGDSLHRHHGEGAEDIAAITDRFGYWFTPGYALFAGRDDELPVDQDQLLAAIAPRPAYVGCGSEDAWADPEGEFLAALSARRLNGGTGPVGFHLRPGGHGLTVEDWRAYLGFCKTHIPAT